MDERSFELGGAVLPVPRLAPLVARLDDVGIVEHARGATPVPDFGHCAEDAGRALGLAALLSSDPDAEVVSSACLRQLERSLRSDGQFTLRLDAVGNPTEDGCSDDATARALWGLANAATGALGSVVMRRAERLLSAAAGFESPHPRAAAHAVLAGAALVSADPRSTIGRRLVDANSAQVPRPARSGSWLWPEPRLAYGNGLLCEALLETGWIRCDDERVDEALSLLRWLEDIERSPAGHFSFTPTGGRGPGDTERFDQQPIEAWTLASACRKAYEITADPWWQDVTAQIAAWFAGANDLGIMMWDPTTGASFDGLTADGVNANQGTESTLALIGTLWVASATAATATYAWHRSDSR